MPCGQVWDEWDGQDDSLCAVGRLPLARLLQLVLEPLHLPHPGPLDEPPTHDQQHLQTRPESATESLLLPLIPTFTGDGEPGCDVGPLLRIRVTYSCHPAGQPAAYKEPTTSSSPSSGPGSVRHTTCGAFATAAGSDLVAAKNGGQSSPGVSSEQERKDLPQVTGIWASHQGMKSADMQQQQQQQASSCVEPHAMAEHQASKRHAGPPPVQPVASASMCPAQGRHSIAMASDGRDSRHAGLPAPAEAPEATRARAPASTAHAPGFVPASEISTLLTQGAGFTTGRGSEATASGLPAPTTSSKVPQEPVSGAAGTSDSSSERVMKACPAAGGTRQIASHMTAALTSMEASRGDIQGAAGTGRHPSAAAKLNSEDKWEENADPNPSLPLAAGCNGPQGAMHRTAGTGNHPSAAATRSSEDESEEVCLVVRLKQALGLAAAVEEAKGWTHSGEEFIAMVEMLDQDGILVTQFKGGGDILEGRRGAAPNTQWTWLVSCPPRMALRYDQE